MSVVNQIKHTVLIKITIICSFLIPVIIFISIFLAISLSPWFDWTNNALSDLGVDGLSAIFFNYGLILGGFLVFIFSLCLLGLLKNKIGAYFLLGSSISLICAGIFPATNSLLHFLTSAAFFILLTISMLVIGITMYFSKTYKTLGIIALFFSIIALLSPLSLCYYNGIAIPEALASFPAFVWCMFFGIKIITDVKLDKCNKSNQSSNYWLM
jgi:hypothetical membrane protein